MGWLSQIPSISIRSKKRLGRGHGSGKVKTAGRGTKGQRARGKIRLGFEGGQLPLIKRLPLWRGKGKNHAFQQKPYPVPVGRLASLSPQTVVTVDLLKKEHIIGKEVAAVKILTGGTLARALTIMLPCSREAKKVIEKAGGKIVSVEV